MSNQTFKAKDEVIDSQYGWGIVQSGNDTDGYEVGFGDILAPDEFPVHVLHRSTSQLKPADHPEPETDENDNLENLRMSYHDERLKAQEMGTSYLDYKEWLEQRLLKQIEFSAQLQQKAERVDRLRDALQIVKSKAEPQPFTGMVTKSSLPDILNKALNEIMAVVKVALESE